MKVSKSLDDYERLIEEFERLNDFKDSKQQRTLCQKKIDQIHARNKKKKTIRGVILAVIIVSLFVNHFYLKPNYYANKAESLLQNGDYGEALEMYNKYHAVGQGIALEIAGKMCRSGDYPDSLLTFMQKLDDKDVLDLWGNMNDGQVLKTEEAIIATAEVGSRVWLGNYEQDNYGSTANEPIEWVVLDKAEDGTLLVVSKYALDCQPYNTEYKAVTWEECTLREWLNGEFYEAVFNNTEKGMIQASENANNDNEEYGTKGGNDTKDKVFLLSLGEAEKYFRNNEERQCKSTAYAISQGAATNDEDYCMWWLRSPGDGSTSAAGVDYDGSLNFSGSWVSYSFIAVRPSLRLHP